MENFTIHMGHTAAHGHSGTLWPAHATMQAHEAWRAHRYITGDLTMTRFMACPPPRLKLHATTPTPQQRRPKRGPQPSIGGSAKALGVEVDKRLQTWI
jgi:hypothetical protein